MFASHLGGFFRRTVCLRCQSSSDDDEAMAAEHAGMASSLLFRHWWLSVAISHPTTHQYSTSRTDVAKYFVDVGTVLPSKLRDIDRITRDLVLANFLNPKGAQAKVTLVLSVPIQLPNFNSDVPFDTSSSPNNAIG